jgi:DNA-binding GntR family transcriptional regulator
VLSLSNDWRVEDELLSDKVTNVLRRLIIERKLEPGSRLVQEELAQRLGVSRMPIRDAFKRLAFEGLVELDSRKGAFVARISRELFREVYSLRALNEPLVNRLSAESLDQEEIAALEDLLRKMDQCVIGDDTYQFAKLNQKFHGILRSRCSWQRLNQFVDALWNGLPPYTPTFIPGQAEQSQLEHFEIVKAIRYQNFDQVERVSRLHIERSGKALVNELTRDGFFMDEGD